MTENGVTFGCPTMMNRRGLQWIYESLIDEVKAKVKEVEEDKNNYRKCEVCVK